MSAYSIAAFACASRAPIANFSAASDVKEPPHEDGRRSRLAWTIASVAVLCFAAPFPAVSAEQPVFEHAARATWTVGPWQDPHFFPIAVWLQNPKHAERYRQAGINTYVGLWRGPTEEQLEQLREAGMHVICAQNEVGLRHLDDPTIIGWMHGDEPDNAQSRGRGQGYGPPIAPEKIRADYRRIQERDATRPVLLNLGQGVAWDDYIGRGVRRNHPEDYPEYVKGCDIASFDIYPAVHDHPDIAGNLWYVARGVERLRRWTPSEKPVWNCLECTRIGNPNRKPTPREVRAEAWMAIIHGSKGLIYFVHQFQPEFREAALLDDAEMLAAVTRLNRRIADLAPVLNTPSRADEATVISSNANVPVAIMVKRHRESTYLFAVGMRAAATRATFTLASRKAAGVAQVLGEDRSIPIDRGEFSDSFEAWDAHLYRIDPD